MAIQGLIFDLDGVLTDTAEYHYLAWKQLADEEGLPFTREDNEQLRGVSRRESLLRLLKGKPVSEETIQEWMTRKNTYYTDYLHQISPNDLLPGVWDFVINAKRDGLKIGLGSASKNARSVMEKLHLLNMFDVIGDGHSVSNPKPSPDLFVWVAGGMQLHTNDVIVFEDAAAGIDAAKAAGCFTVGIGSSEVQHADYVTQSLEGIMPNKLIEQFMVSQ